MKLFSYRYIPLNIYIAYCLFTLCCLLVVPIRYQQIDYLTLIGYMGLIIGFFTTGYIFGAKGHLLDKRQLNLEASRALSRNAYLSIKSLLGILLWISTLYVLHQWYQVFTTSGFDLDLSKLGESYVNYYENYERGQANVNLAYILNILIQTCLTLTLFIGAYYLREMSSTKRWVFLFIITSYVMINVLVSGKQKFFGDVVIIFFFFSMLNFARYRKKIKISRLAIAFAMFLVVVMVFVELLNQRYVAAGIGLHNIAEFAHPLTQWNDASLWFEIFGERYGFAMGIFLGYFTNGLYGLSLSLQLPFEWTYFVGNSYSLARVVEIIFEGTTIIDKSYPVRVGLEYGWDLSKWHSLFAWLASDFTFAGVLILALFFGILYGKLWVLAVSYANSYAGPLFLNFSLGLIFSLSNNQIMHGMAGVISVFVLLLGYFLSTIDKKDVVLSGRVNHRV